MKNLFISFEVHRFKRKYVCLRCELYVLLRKPTNIFKLKRLFSFFLLVLYSSLIHLWVRSRSSACTYTSCPGTSRRIPSPSLWAGGHDAEGDTMPAVPNGVSEVKPPVGPRNYRVVSKRSQLRFVPLGMVQCRSWLLSPEAVAASPGSFNRWKRSVRSDWKCCWARTKGGYQ